MTLLICIKFNALFFRGLGVCGGSMTAIAPWSLILNAKMDQGMYFQL